MGNQELRIKIKEARVYFNTIEISLGAIVEDNAEEFARAIQNTMTKRGSQRYVMPKELAERLASAVRAELIKVVNNRRGPDFNRTILERHIDASALSAVKYAESRVHKGYEDYKGFYDFVEEL